MSAQAQLFLFAFALDLLGILIFRRYAAAFTPAGRSSIMAWTLLILAGLTEVIWLVALKKSNGFTDTWQGAVSITISWVSFFLLAYALKFIPIGTAYAVCTGFGVAGGAIAGMWLFGEDRNAIRVGSIALIMAGIVGVHLSESADGPGGPGS